MKSLSAETVWQMTDENLLRVIQDGLFSCEPKRIHFYAPSFMYYKTRYYCSSTVDFPTISVTGKNCTLKCGHCSGKVLETMYPATTPDQLLELCKRLKQEGASGCLISGGCLPDGSIPLGHFADTIGRIKSELGLTVVVHTGLIDSGTARSLAQNGVDTALIDVMGSDETISEICNLNARVEDYARSLGVLNEARISFVPHVITGLHYGKLKGERYALEMISKFKPSALVIIAFMPIRGTTMEGIRPPKPVDIAKVIVAARLMMPGIPLVLGCMRPKGKHRKETDVLAIKCGVAAIAFPAEEAVAFAREQGYGITFSSQCCCQTYVDVRDWGNNEK
jgi:uncharacterized radical SAM superfamily protein